MFHTKELLRTSKNTFDTATQGPRREAIMTRLLCVLMLLGVMTASVEPNTNLLKQKTGKRGKRSEA